MLIKPKKKKGVISQKDEQIKYLLKGIKDVIDLLDNEQLKSAKQLLKKIMSTVHNIKYDKGDQDAFADDFGRLVLLHSLKAFYMAIEDRGWNVPHMHMGGDVYMCEFFKKQMAEARDILKKSKFEIGGE